MIVATSDLTGWILLIPLQIFVLALLVGAIFIVRNRKP